MMAVTLGLKFDLKKWNVELLSASDAVGKRLNAKTLTPFNAGLTKMTSGIGSAVTKMLALSSAVGGIYALKRGFEASMEAADAHADSVLKLQGALKNLGIKDVGGSLKGFDTLGESMRLALGVGRTETNQAGAMFMQRGNNEAMSKRLTLLSGALSKSMPGSSMGDTAKLVAEAASGGADAIKSLGLEVAITKDKTTDAAAAMAAMNEMAGRLGTDLVDPADRLSAALDELSIQLGDRLLPVLEPVTNGLAAFANGLVGTDEGLRLLGDVGHGVTFTVDWIGESAKQLENVLTAVGNTIMLTARMAVGGIGMMARGSNVVTGGLLGKALDGMTGTRNILPTFTNQVLKDAGRNAQDAVSAFSRWEKDQSGPIAKRFEGVRAAGEARRMAAENAVMAGLRDNTGNLAPSAVAVREDAIKEARQGAGAARARGRTATKFADVVGGETLRVTLVNTASDPLKGVAVN